MPGTQLSRRHFSFRARESQRRFKHGSRKMVTEWWTDFINPSLIPIKITFFFIVGATQCISPFATLFKKSLGLTVEETAIIYTVGPIIPVLAPLLAGLMADKIGDFRTFLVISVALSGLFALISIGIPPARTLPKVENKSIEFDLTCEADLFKVTYARGDECMTPKMAMRLDTLKVSNCGYLCSSPAIQVDATMQNLAENWTMTSVYNETISYSCHIGTLRGQKCFYKDPKSEKEKIKGFSLRNVVFQFGLVKLTGNMVTLLLEHYTMSPGFVHAYDCSTGSETDTVSIRKIFIPEDLKSSSAEPEYVDCQFHCEGHLSPLDTCNSTSELEVHNVQLSIGLFIMSTMLSYFMVGMTYTMFEAGVVAILKEHNYDYGVQRIYGSIGGMVFAPLTGYLIDYFGKDHYSDYYIAFFLYCALKLLSAGFLTKLNLTFKKPTRNMFGNITSIFSSIEAILLIVIVFVSGMCYGFIEHFLPWHIRDLGAENWMIGLMTTVANVAAIPFLAMSDMLCRKFGHIQCISFGLLCYGVRCLGYSLLFNPYWCFPFEVLEGITTGLLVAAAIIYGAKLSHSSNVGTLQGMIATFHYGFGKSAGSFLGGYLMGKLGPRPAFQIFCGIACGTAFLYYLIFKLAIKPRHDRLKRHRREVYYMPVEIVPNENLSEGLERINANSQSQKFPITSTPKKCVVDPEPVEDI